MIVDLTKFRKAINEDKEKRKDPTETDVLFWQYIQCAISVIEFHAPGWHCVVEGDTK